MTLNLRSRSTPAKHTDVADTASLKIGRQGFLNPSPCVSAPAGGSCFPASQLERTMRDSVSIPRNITLGHLSFGARGLLAYLITMPDRRWSIQDMTSNGGIGITRLKTLLCECELAGYIQLVNHRTSEGLLRPYYKVSSTPLVDADRNRPIYNPLGTCFYCGDPATTIDHVFPTSRGGPDDESNTVLACVKCNAKKGNRTPAEARMVGAQ